MKIKKIAVIFFIAFSVNLFAVEKIDPGALWILFKEDITLSGGDYSIYDNTGIDINYTSPSFVMKINGAFNNDGKYPSQDSSYGGRYLAVNDAYVQFFSGDVSFKAGRAVHRDIVDTPYSVFISSQNIPALIMDIFYKGDFFFYESRWIRLNTRSAYTYNGTEKNSKYWAEKGANFKIFGINLGDFRLGFEDSITYLDRAFDAEYFFNPMPEFFTELITTSGGAPWKEKSNTNSLLGFFTDITRPEWYGEAQFLMDDFNADFITGRNNCTVTKIAWSLGGFYKFNFGNIGFYTGGATKYTFEATYGNESDYSTLPYEYTYYPVVEYGSNETPVYYTENYVGYKYGENNISFLLDYKGDLFEHTPYAISLYSSLELVLNGSKSPSNPWHEYYWCTPICPHTILIDDPVVEKQITSVIRLSKKWNDWNFTFGIKSGYVFNQLELKDLIGDGSEAKIYVANPDSDYAFLDVTLSVSYDWVIKD